VPPGSAPQPSPPAVRGADQGFGGPTPRRAGAPGGGPTERCGCRPVASCGAPGRPEPHGNDVRLRRWPPTPGGSVHDHCLAWVCVLARFPLRRNLQPAVGSDAPGAPSRSILYLPLRSSRVGGPLARPFPPLPQVNAHLNCPDLDPSSITVARGKPGAQRRCRATQALTIGRFGGFGFGYNPPYGHRPVAR
jgi:hypothetical protein